MPPTEEQQQLAEFWEAFQRDAKQLGIAFGPLLSIAGTESFTCHVRFVGPPPSKPLIPA